MGLGGQNWFAKQYSQAPLGLGKLDPVANHFFGHYTSGSGPGTPGPWAGAAPSLSAAQAGYTGTPPGPTGAAPGSQPALAGANPYVAAAQGAAGATPNASKLYGAPQARVQTPTQPGALYG